MVLKVMVIAQHTLVVHRCLLALRVLVVMVTALLVVAVGAEEINYINSKNS